MDIYVLGVDNGNAETKTSSGIKFPSGYGISLSMPLSLDRCIYFNKTYYTVGTERLPVMEDKTTDERCLILTYAAIAASMKKDGIPKTDGAYKADVCLAVGLPIAHYRKFANNFEKYFLRGSIEFTYEGELFSINIAKVEAFPQGYSASMYFDKSDSYSFYNFIDIGGGTIDYSEIHPGGKHKNPASLDYGVVKLFNDIDDTLKAQRLPRLNEMQIQGILDGSFEIKNHDAGEQMHDICENYRKIFANRIKDDLREHRLNIDLNPNLYIGGGAMLLKDALYVRNTDFFLDEYANARAYKQLILDSLEQQGIDRGEDDSGTKEI